MNDHPRFRACIWTLTVAILAVLLAHQLLRGISLQSSIIALLPPSESDPVVEEVLDRFSQRAGQHLLFLVGHTEKGEKTVLVQRFAKALHATGAFSEIQFEHTELEQQLLNLYLPHRFGLAPPAIMAALSKPDSAQEFLAATQRLLYLPMSGFYTRFLADDPLLLFPRFLETLLPSRGKLSLDDGILSVSHQGLHYGLVVARFTGDPFVAEVQQRVLAAVAEVEREIAEASAQADIRFTGIPRFADAGAANMQSEMSLIAMGSLLGIFLLLMLTFRSARFFLLAALPIAVGILAAFSLSLSVFSQVHLVTLGFGASLIGVCIDYTFHYFSDCSLHPLTTRLSALRRILPGITLGLCTSCIGYLGLGLPPFPGLRQMSFFSVVGLLSAFATVACWFPYLARPQPQLRQSFLFAFASSVSGAAQSKAGRIALASAALIVLLLGGAGMRQLAANDDIRLLQDAPDARWPSFFKQASS